VASVDGAIAGAGVQRGRERESAREEKQSTHAPSFYKADAGGSWPNLEIAIWSVCCAVALLWPSRAIGALDGIPLDSRLEAIAIGLLFPALCWLHPRFLATVLSRALVAALLALKIGGALLLVQQGWCVRFIMPAPLNADANLTQLSWDARADWRHAVPRCSAVAARPYADVYAFPAWFLNLGGPPDRPPRALVAMTVDGYLSASSPGTLALGFANGQPVAGSIDDRSIDQVSGDVALSSGTHRVKLSTVITGDAWRFSPTWNRSNLYSSVLTTVDPPRAVDRWLSNAAAVAIAVLAFALLAAWAASAARSLALPPMAMAWTLGLTAVTVVAGMTDIYRAGRLAVVLLLAAPLVRLPERLRTIRGAFLVVGIPWLALIAGSTLAGVGRFTLFTPGDDFSLFQRYAYRIYVQGYWLEGGQWTFWFQPLYRWIIGPLHIVFGDSSVGEWYLDAACLLVGALFAFVVCDGTRSFAWGIFAAALTLATVAIGPSWWVVGRDLSEITAAGFAYAAALILVGDDACSARLSAERALAAGILAVVCFYTRLNHLIWLATFIVLLLPLDVTAEALWSPRTWLSRRRAISAVVFLAALAAGVLLFAWRTWYYTGMFSVLYGTQRDLVATVQPTDSFGRAILHMIQSVLVQVTVQDPPRFEARSLPIMIGVLVSLLALVRVPWCRDVPAAPALLCVTGLAGALVARGTAYIGRFSIHLMPVAVAVAVCFAATSFRRVRSAPAASAT
jgi:hypothetical protein